MSYFVRYIILLQQLKTDIFRQTYKADFGEIKQEYVCVWVAVLARINYIVFTKRVFSYKSQSVVLLHPTIFLLVVAAVNILYTRQVLLNMAPNAKENPTESTAARAC